MNPSQAKLQCISFYKLQGAGNDFVVFLAESLKCAESEKSKFIRAIADRRLGIGCDQVLEVTSLQPTLAVQIWNQDGSTAEMCANGARAFALLARQKGWVQSAASEFTLQVSGRPYTMQRADEPEFGDAINLGKVQWRGHQVLAINQSNFTTQIPVALIEAPNPHAVVFLGKNAGEWIPPEGLADFDFHAWGRALEVHPHFPHRTNVEFVYSIKTDSHLLVEAKVWERGSGATASSGSGSVAVATATWEKLGRLEPVQVEMNGNKLKVYKNQKAETLLAGPAEIVAKGEFFY